uniref:Alpha-(1->3)-arabinofuranosyltransferase n=1 Tax=Janibacter limosus TaxID=53458 RepID=A0AC61U8F9_9MICO|nr:alpha-(1->3)-arabinofuranosyltransferase [Janibacter limosus]
MLDRVDDLTATGRSQPALAQGLRRLGVSRVVVRGGLDPDVGAVDPVRVAATFAASPGVSLARSVGEGSDRISVWRLDEPATPVSLVPSAAMVDVAGAPEAWFALVAAGLLDPDALTTQADGAHADVRSDTLRWQALNSGRPAARGHGPTLPADDERPAVVGTRDPAPGGQPVGRTTRFYAGPDALRVTSSAADPFAADWRGAGSGPAAMVDGDPRTAWLSGDGSPTQTVTVDLPDGSRPDALLVHAAWGSDIAPRRRGGGRWEHRTPPAGVDDWRVPLDGRERRSLTVSLTGDTGPAGTAQQPLGVRELELEGGPRMSTGLSVPEGPGPVLLTRDPRGAVLPEMGEDPPDLVRSVGPLPQTQVSATVRARADESGPGSRRCSPEPGRQHPARWVPTRRRTHLSAGGRDRR